MLAALVRHWDVKEVASLVWVPEAMNSRVWIVETNLGRSVVKAVPDVGQFSGALRVATAVERSGLRTGAPLPTRKGDLCIDIDGNAVALLRYVPERGLESAAADDRQRWGQALAHLHQHLTSIRVPPFADQWPWQVPDPTSSFLDAAPWLRPTIDDAVEDAASRWRPERNMLIHGDPSASDFRVDAIGQLAAVIDWGYAMAGPPLHDLACAVLFEWLDGRDGSDVVAAYHREIAVDYDLFRSLLRRRLALQAWWLSWREATGSDLGSRDEAWNRRSLSTIREFFDKNGWLRVST